MKRTIYFQNQDGYQSPVLIEYRITDSELDFYAGINGRENNLVLAQARKAETNDIFRMFDLVGNFECLEKIAIAEIEKTGGKISRKDPVDKSDLEIRVRTFGRSKLVGEPYYLFESPSFILQIWRNFKIKGKKAKKFSYLELLYIDDELKRLYGDFYLKPTEFFKN